MKRFLLTLLVLSFFNSAYAFEELNDIEMSHEHAGTSLSNDINLSILNVVPLFNMIDFNNRQLINNQRLNDDGSITFILNDIDKMNIQSSIGNIELLGIKLKGTEITIKPK